MKSIFVSVVKYFLKYAERHRVYSVKAIRIKFSFFPTDVLFRWAKKKKNKPKNANSLFGKLSLPEFTYCTNFLTVKKRRGKSGLTPTLSISTFFIKIIITKIRLYLVIEGGIPMTSSLVSLGIGEGPL